MIATRTPQAPQATIAEQLYTLADPLVMHFRCDLQYDQEWLAKNPSKPFLWQVRETGTSLIGLYSLDELPGPGAYVPYLFGMADADHLAREIKAMADCLTAEYSLPSLLLCYCNGANDQKD